MTTQIYAGKTVFVTGAGSGIGYGLCEGYAKTGATVALNDINPELAQTAAQKINAEVGRTAVIATPFDVADVRALRQAIQQFAQELKGFGRHNGVAILICRGESDVFWAVVRMC